MSLENEFLPFLNNWWLVLAVVAAMLFYSYKEYIQHRHAENAAVDDGKKSG